MNEQIEELERETKKAEEIKKTKKIEELDLLCLMYLFVNDSLLIETHLEEYIKYLKILEEHGEEYEYEYEYENEDEKSEQLEKINRITRKQVIEINTKKLEEIQQRKKQFKVELKSRYWEIYRYLKYLYNEDENKWHDLKRLCLALYNFEEHNYSDIIKRVVLSAS